MLQINILVEEIFRNDDESTAEADFQYLVAMAELVEPYEWANGQKRRVYGLQGLHVGLGDDYGCS